MAQGQHRSFPQPGQMQSSASVVSSQPNMANGVNQDGIKLRQEMLNRM